MSADIEKVFLSSTYKDLKRYRRSASTAIRRFGWLSLEMEDFLARDDRPKDLCLKLVKQSDLYIGIFAHRYGHIPEGARESITEQEYRCAMDAGIKCLIFIVDDRQPWRKEWIDSRQPEESLARLKQELRQQNTTVYFTTEDNLSALISASLARHTREARLVQQQLALAKRAAVVNDAVPVVTIRVFAHPHIATDVRCRVVNASDFPTQVKTVLSSSVAGVQYPAPVPGHYAGDNTWDLPAFGGFEGHFDFEYLLRPAGITFADLARTGTEVGILIEYSATTLAGRWRNLGRARFHFDPGSSDWIVDP